MNSSFIKGMAFKSSTLSVRVMAITGIPITPQEKTMENLRILRIQIKKFPIQPIPATILTQAMKSPFQANKTP